MESRKSKEARSLFEDPRFSRQAWKSVGRAILERPAIQPIATVDKEGNETLNSQIERYTYNSLANDIAILQHEDRKPTELEMILGCQIMKARTDTSAAIFVRDTLGAKPVDESKMDHTLHNDFEQLSDEELELLAAHREKKKLAPPVDQPAIEASSPTETVPSTPIADTDTVTEVTDESNA